MKHALHTLSFLLIGIFILPLLCSSLTAQTPEVVFSRFEFNTKPLTQASQGPNALYNNPNAETDGIGAYINDSCGSQVGLDLLLDNSNGVYNLGSLGMRYNFKKYENFADFYRYEDFAFYIQGGMLMVTYQTLNSQGFLNTWGPFPTGYFILQDGQFHLYDFQYQAYNGVAKVSVDGNQVWTFDGPDAANLYWGNGGDNRVGTIMDGTCQQNSILDFAEFYIPANPLPVEWVDFQVNTNSNNDAQLNWITSQEVNNAGYMVQRSANSIDFENVGFVPPTTPASNGLYYYSFQDSNLSAGTYLYRILQLNDNGESFASPTQFINVMEQNEVNAIVYPNPTTDYLHLELTNYKSLILIDYLGRTISERSIASNFDQLTLDLTSIPNGSYLLLLTSDTDQKSFPIVKN